MITVPNSLSAIAQTISSSNDTYYPIEQLKAEADELIRDCLDSEVTRDFVSTKAKCNDIIQQYQKFCQERKDKVVTITQMNQFDVLRNQEIAGGASESDGFVQQKTSLDGNLDTVVASEPLGPKGVSLNTILEEENSKVYVAPNIQKEVEANVDVVTKPAKVNFRGAEPQETTLAQEQAQPRVIPDADIDREYMTWLNGCTMHTLIRKDIVKGMMKRIKKMTGRPGAGTYTYTAVTQENSVKALAGESSVSIKVNLRDSVSIKHAWIKILQCCNVTEEAMRLAATIFQ